MHLLLFLWILSDLSIIVIHDRLRQENQHEIEYYEIRIELRTIKHLLTRFFVEGQ